MMGIKDWIFENMYFYKNVNLKLLLHISVGREEVFKGAEKTGWNVFPDDTTRKDKNLLE